MQLYSYFRSSAAYRVRIALNLKGVDYQHVPVNLLHSEQLGDAYRTLQPQGLVPALVLEDGSSLMQSTAILEWLEESFHTPSLYPSDPIARARTRALCNMVACDIHPINNLRVLKYLQSELGADDAQKKAWYQHWVVEGFGAIETLLAEGPFALGEQLSMADVYLVPQVFNALRFDVDMSPFPKLASLYQQCNTLKAFQDAEPGRQPDAN